MKRVVGVLLALAILVSVTFLAVPSLKKGAQNTTVTPLLILKEMKVMKEEHPLAGDELYVTLSARRAAHPTEYVRIPAGPDHWLSRQIELIKNVNLWSEPLIDGEAVTLIIELNEQHALPLIPDDLLGIMRVKLKNEKGVLNAQWDIPNLTGIDSPKKLVGSPPDSLAKESENAEKFDLQNEGAHYEVLLLLKP